MFNTENIKKIRVKNNFSQKDIANKLNISRSSYAMWESNNNIFPIKRLIEFCNITKSSLNYALGIINYNIITEANYDINKIQKRLKEFRKENKMTQEKLAFILNTNKSVICNYEKGRNIIATPFLYEICKKYNISADYLLGRIDEPKYLKTHE